MDPPNLQHYWWCNLCDDRRWRASAPATCESSSSPDAGLSLAEPDEMVGWRVVTRRRRESVEKTRSRLAATNYFQPKAAVVRDRAD